jgi:hypothetical protein
MALEFNITAADKFFLGEDKVVDISVVGADNVTPYDVSLVSLEWNLRKTDGGPDPAIMTKTPTIVGVYNADPLINTQRVRVTFASDDTDPLVTVTKNPPYKLKANVAYRHSLKRKDVGHEAIVSYGSFTFLQATER